jgi:hypothetical protein
MVGDDAREELVDAHEIARRLALASHRTVLDWRLHHAFPHPVTRRGAYLWRWADIARWRDTPAAISLLDHAHSSGGPVAT